MKRKKTMNRNAIKCFTVIIVIKMKIKIIVNYGSCEFIVNSLL